MKITPNFSHAGDVDPSSRRGEGRLEKLRLRDVSLFVAWKRSVGEDDAWRKGKEAFVARPGRGFVDLQSGRIICRCGAGGGVG